MPPLIRPAKFDDAPFLAWVVLAASRSHVPRGVWDLWIENDDAERQSFLEALLTSDPPHWCHYSGFLIAEVDGQPAAGLSGYSHEDSALAPPAEAIVEASKRCGWTDEDLGRGLGRLSPFLGCLPDDAPGAWVVEWVATRPAHRRQGLVEALMEAELEEGRRRGHALAQIMILMGNDPAERAYLKAGFRVEGEKRSGEMADKMGTEGVRWLLRAL